MHSLRHDEKNFRPRVDHSQPKLIPSQHPESLANNRVDMKGIQSKEKKQQILNRESISSINSSRIEVKRGFLFVHRPNLNYTYH
jgi:hypothetical protein